MDPKVSWQDCSRRGRGLLLQRVVAGMALSAGESGFRPKAEQSLAEKDQRIEALEAVSEQSRESRKLFEDSLGVRRAPSS